MESKADEKANYAAGRQQLPSSHSLIFRQRLVAGQSQITEPPCISPFTPFDCFPLQPVDFCILKRCPWLGTLQLQKLPEQEIAHRPRNGEGFALGK